MEDINIKYELNVTKYYWFTSDHDVTEYDTIFINYDDEEYYGYIWQPSEEENQERHLNPIGKYPKSYHDIQNHIS